MGIKNSKFEVPTKCICPSCEKKHKTKMHWVGNGMPRIYCTKCKYKAIKYNNLPHIRKPNRTNARSSQE